jgi:hypothetical protein
MEPNADDPLRATDHTPVPTPEAGPEAATVDDQRASPSANATAPGCGWR